MLWLEFFYSQAPKERYITTATSNFRLPGLVS
jgi:hypothetical protein